MINMTDSQLLTAYGQHGNIAGLRNVASIASQLAVQQHLVDANKMIDPFGYFRPTIDGWEDCAEHDEGARPLYERPSSSDYEKSKKDCYVLVPATPTDSMCEAADNADYTSSEGIGISRMFGTVEDPDDWQSAVKLIWAAMLAAASADQGVSS